MFSWDYFINKRLGSIGLEHDIIRTIMKFVWDEATKKDFQLSAYCMAGLFFILFAGYLSDHMFYASIASSGAISVGFGANKKLMRYPLAPMIIAGVGMSIAAFVGSLAGNFYFVYVVLCMLLGALCSQVGVIDQNAWWICLQWSTALIVAGYFPGDWHQAVLRSSLVFSGATIEFLFILFFLKKLQFDRNVLDVHRIKVVLHHIHHNIDRKIHFRKLALRGMFAILFSLFFIHLCTWGLGYLMTFEMLRPYLPDTSKTVLPAFWATITTLIVLKPSVENTLVRSKDRMIGTLIGFVIADALYYLGGGTVVLIVEFLLFSFLSFALASRPYIVLTTFITISTVLIFTFAGQPEPQVAVERMIATLIGGLSALGAIFLTTRSSFLGSGVLPKDP